MQLISSSDRSAESGATSGSSRLVDGAQSDHSEFGTNLANCPTLDYVIISTCASSYPSGLRHAPHILVRAPDRHTDT